MSSSVEMGPHLVPSDEKGSAQKAVAFASKLAYTPRDMHQAYLASLLKALSGSVDSSNAKKNDCQSLCRKLTVAFCVSINYSTTETRWCLGLVRKLALGIFDVGIGIAVI